MPKPKTYPLKCYICGRFIGKDGFPDIYYDDWNGGWEDGGSMCVICGKRSREKLKSLYVSPEAMDEIKNWDNIIKEEEQNNDISFRHL